MPSRQQGYILMALGPVQYLDMATNLAASIKTMDPGRPVCLVHGVGAKIPDRARRLFDDAVGLADDSRYPHVMNKLRLFEVSPYGSTMFVDADCLLMKRDINHYWAAVSSRAFSITGGPRRQGTWKGVRIEDVLREVGAEYLIQMNAGVFHFDDSDGAGELFAGLERFYIDHMNKLNISNYRGPRSQSFELYLGLFMGLQNMNCDNVRNTGPNSWMVSTWRALWCQFDPKQGKSIIYKGDRHVLDVPFLPRKVTRLSPTFAHFIALKPRRTYERLVRTFEQMAMHRWQAELDSSVALA